VRQLKRIAEELTRRVRESEPAFFMGDMNDAWHPQRILMQAGFVSCFAALGMQSPPTFQCYPTANVQPGERTITEAIDLIVANKYARAIAASVPQCYAGDLAPSDHWDSTQEIAEIRVPLRPKPIRSEMKSSRVKHVLPRECHPVPAL